MTVNGLTVLPSTIQYLCICWKKVPPRLSRIVVEALLEVVCDLGSLELQLQPKANKEEWERGAERV